MTIGHDKSLLHSNKKDYHFIDNPCLFENKIAVILTTCDEALAGGNNSGWKEGMTISWFFPLVMQELFPLQGVEAIGKRTTLILEAPSSVVENFIFPLYLPV